MTSILSGLDFYKLTMSQQAWRIAPDAEVTFTLKNRSSQSLLKCLTVAQVRTALEPFEAGFDFSDLLWLRKNKTFDPQFLVYLNGKTLPVPMVVERDGDLHVEVTGPWPLVTFWETIVMSTINDLYFANGNPWYQTYGHEKLTSAIHTLGRNPGIKFSDFGTRRRYSFGWQAIVVARCAAELPEQFVGTSNPYLAQQYGLKPIGTFAHEMPMVYAALVDGAVHREFERDMIPNDFRASHDLMLNEWFDTYGYDYSIALTDTFGSDFFFSTFGEERAHTWKGLRHDSGDPFEFGDKAIKFYEKHGVDPRTKTIVFSDGLDLGKILALHQTFGDEFNLMFGWGTGLTNNVGVEPLNIVMKATSVNGVGTVKLSDDEGKHTGNAEDIDRYLNFKREFSYAK